MTPRVKRWLRSAGIFLLGAAVVWVSFASGFVKAASVYSPYCATEDSCSAQYNGHTHHWEIVQVRP